MANAKGLDRIGRAATRNVSVRRFFRCLRFDAEVAEGTLYRLYIGIADGMPIARVWVCRYSRWNAFAEAVAFAYRHARTPRSRHMIGDAGIKHAI